MQSAPETSKQPPFLFQHALGEATNVLVIDESVGSGPDQCRDRFPVDAPGVSRLDQKAGPSLFSMHQPTSCRRGEHPHYVRDCPPNRDSPHAERRSVHQQRHYHRLRELRRELPLRRDQMADVDPRPGFLETTTEEVHG